MAGFRTFATGEVLTAANVNDFLMKQSVMVFADDAARTAALGAEVVEGMLTYNLDTGSLEVFDGAAFGPVVTAKEKRVDGFTGSGTFVVPAGVTFAIAHMRGGGGGVGTLASGGNGSASSVAFASGTVTAPGNNKTMHPSSVITGPEAGAANSGQNAVALQGDSAGVSNGGGSTSAYIVAGADVTPAAAITVTVGAGGAAGTNGAAGGSGYVYIEYFEEA